MSDESIPQRAAAEQRIAAIMADVSHPGERAYVGAVTDIAVTYALQTALDAVLRGDRPAYEDARAHLLALLRGRRPIVAMCGGDDELLQGFIDHYLQLYILARARVETAPPDLPPLRVAKLNPSVRGRPSGRHLSPVEFHTVLAGALRRLSGSQLTLQRLVGKLQMDRKTLSAYLDDPAYGPPWRLLKQWRTLEACERSGLWTRPRI